MRRKMTRRKFLKTAAAVSAVGILTACGGTPSEGSGGGSNSEIDNGGQSGGGSNSEIDNGGQGGGSSSGENKEPEEPKDDSDQDQPTDETKANWRYLLLSDGTAQICGYDGTLTGAVVIPETIDSYAVSKVTGLRHQNGILTLTIPASVKEVGDYAFSDCVSLTTVRILGRRRLEAMYLLAVPAWWTLSSRIQRN